ncbi:MAG: glutamate mutase [Firmicutes bacterium]|nr:glutamate mutase [Bacillota bacterium]
MRKFDYLVIDIGSTYTKQRLFKDRELKASAQSPTTLENVYEGIKKGQEVIKEKMGLSSLEAEHFLAASSAAGGLRMVAMGYMTRVTAKAAKEVAMNAGAKILEVISFEDMPEYRVQILKEIKPDIILLAGGTDYGDEESLLENASLIVKSGVRCIVVIAGNIKAQEKAAEILKQGNIDYVRVPNIMPTIHELRVKEARDVIHREFIRQITRAEGSHILKDKITNGKIIPTPGAVLMGAELLAKGIDGEKGLGALIVVDLGGATTDVHSVLPEMEDLSEEERGLVISNEKQVSYRTVEGNLGLRVSAGGIIDTVKPKRILMKRNIQDETTVERLVEYCRFLEKNNDHIPQNREEEMFDTLLAETAVETALKRHSGYIAQEVDPVMGITPGMPIGRDLRKVQKVIAVGGFFHHRPASLGQEVIKNALRDRGISLLPENPEVLIDKDYILFAAGIISQTDEEYAYHVLKRYFKF